MKPKDFIGVKASYDKCGTQIYGNDKKGNQQLILDVRGWGAIQHLFKEAKGMDLAKAANFQDECGQWFVDAINEKLEKESLIEEKELNDKIDEWHNGSFTEPLYKYLGLTKKEYEELVLSKNSNNEL